MSWQTKVMAQVQILRRSSILGGINCTSASFYPLDNTCCFLSCSAGARAAAAQGTAVRLWLAVVLNVH